jgi:hypothetical protein
VTPCVVCTMHVEMRSTGFLVELQNQGQRFVSGLASEPLSGLQFHHKIGGSGFLRFGLTTGGDNFLRFVLKTSGDGFLQFVLKTGGDGFSQFGIKTGGGFLG